jgi:hypothetical protein
MKNDGLFIGKSFCGKPLGLIPGITQSPNGRDIPYEKDRPRQTTATVSAKKNLGVFELKIHLDP